MGSGAHTWINCVFRNLLFVIFISSNLRPTYSLLIARFILFYSLVIYYYLLIIHIHDQIPSTVYYRVYELINI